MKSSHNDAEYRYPTQKIWEKGKHSSTNVPMIQNIATDKLHFSKRNRDS